MKRKKLSVVLLLLLIPMALIACGDGYNTTNYIGQTLEDQTGRILTIGEFRGNKEDQWQFQEATVIDVEIMVEEGAMKFTFADPEEQVIFQQEVREGETFRERFEGDFLKGSYQLKLESKKAKNVALEIRGQDL